MNQLISKDYNSSRIRINPTSKLVCLTDVCKASGKNVADFVRLQGTTDYIYALSCAMGNPIEELLIVEKSSRGTWGHPQLAIKCAGWCSPEFEVLVTSWVWELLSTGKVEIYPQTHQNALPENESDRVTNMASTVAKPKALKEPRDKVRLPGWSQIRESIAKYCKDESLANNRKFRHFISRQFADVYRSLFSEEPPRVTRGKHKGYCYPPSFDKLVGNYIERWLTIPGQLPAA